MKGSITIVAPSVVTPRAAIVAPAVVAIPATIAAPVVVATIPAAPLQQVAAPVAVGATSSCRRGCGSSRVA